MFWEIQRRWLLWDFFRRLRKHGWRGTYVPQENGVGELAYTVGFQDSLGAPEVVTFGWTMQDANNVLWEIYRTLKAGELTLTDFKVWDAPWGPEPKIAWRCVHRSQIRRQYFNFCIIYAERTGRPREDIQVFQLVVGDKNGVMPWEAGFDIDTKPIQPRLWEPYSGPPDED